jgi:hypothetical protein
MFQFFVLFLEKTVVSIKHNWLAALHSIVLVVESEVQTLFIFSGCKNPQHEPDRNALCNGPSTAGHAISLFHMKIKADPASETMDRVQTFIHTYDHIASLESFKSVTFVFCKFYDSYMT